MTLTVDIAPFATSLADTGRGIRTVRSYESDLRSFQQWSHDQDAPDDLAVGFSRWLNATRHAAAPATTRRRLVAARSYLKHAGLPLGPLSDYRTPPPTPSRPRPLPGGMSDVTRMLEATDDPRLHRAVALGSYAGLRVSETRAASPLSVDWADNELVVCGKGEKTRRVPLSPSLSRILGAADGDGLYVPLSDSRLRTVIKDLAAKIGAPDYISSHSLRATFATSLYDKSGHDIVMVSKMLGHASIATTQVYLGFDMSGAHVAVDW